jgi:hypothetical protein
MSNYLPLGCYLAKPGSQPWPQTALPLWNDDVESVQTIPHLMDKAAEPDVAPGVVARFSEISDAVARIAPRGAGNCWVISRTQKP